MSTTGYGDFVPASKLGKVVAAFSVTYGLVMLSFPIALLGSQFTEEWKAFKFEQLEEAERKGLETGGLKRRLEHTPAQIAHILRGHIGRIDAILAEAQVHRVYVMTLLTQLSSIGASGGNEAMEGGSDGPLVQEQGGYRLA